MLKRKRKFSWKNIGDRLGKALLFLLYAALFWRNGTYYWRDLILFTLAGWLLIQLAILLLGKCMK